MGLTMMPTTSCRPGAPVLATQCQPPAIGDVGSFDHLSVLAAIICKVIDWEWQVHGVAITSARARRRPVVDIQSSKFDAAKLPSAMGKSMAVM
jgi:hypothetical protein